MTDDLVDGRPSGRPPGRLPGARPGAGPARDSRVPGVRILHVDDDDLNRALVRTALARSAEPLLRTARLIETADLARARAVLAEGPVDIVLLDMRLPDGSGLALATEMKQADATARPILVALTGAVEPDQRGAALAAGCTAVLIKPYSVTCLCDLLVAQLRRRAGPGAAPPGATLTSRLVANARSRLTIEGDASRDSRVDFGEAAGSGR